MMATASRAASASPIGSGGEAAVLALGAGAPRAGALLAQMLVLGVVPALVLRAAGTAGLVRTARTAAGGPPAVVRDLRDRVGGGHRGALAAAAGRGRLEPDPAPTPEVQLGPGVGVAGLDLVGVERPGRGAGGEAHRDPGRDAQQPGQHGHGEREL